MGSHVVPARPSYVLRRVRVCFVVFLVSFRDADLPSVPRFVRVFRSFVVFFSFGGPRETHGSFAVSSRVTKPFVQVHVRKTNSFFVVVFFLLFDTTCFFPLHLDVRGSCFRPCSSRFVSFCYFFHVFHGHGLVTHRCPRTLARIVLLRRLGLRDVHVRHSIHALRSSISFRLPPRGSSLLSHGSIRTCKRSATSMAWCVLRTWWSWPSSHSTPHATSNTMASSPSLNPSQSLSLNPSLPHCLSLSISVTQSLSPSLSQSISLPHCLSVNLSPSLSLSLNPPHCLSVSIPLTFSRSHWQSR